MGHRYDVDRSSDPSRSKIEHELIIAGARPPLTLRKIDTDYYWFVDAYGANAKWIEGEVQVERKYGPGIRLQDGGYWRGHKGHAFVNKHPRRLVVVGRFDTSCDQCGRPFETWVTDDSIWSALPKDDQKMYFCVPCFIRKVLER